jgi:transcriptional regulator with XRE-family HTH domain
MTITENLKRIRIEHKYRQSEVADAIAISRPRYTNFEIDRNPDIHILMKLADFYNITLDVLVGRRNLEIQELNLNKKDEDKKLLWQSNIRNRKTDDLLMFMLFLLRIIRSEKIKVIAERAMQTIAKYIIKNAYSYINRGVLAQGDEALALHRKLFNDIWQLTDGVNDRFNSIKDDVDEDTFTIEELSKPEIINKYFHVDVNSILYSDPNEPDASETERQNENLDDTD